MTGPAAGDGGVGAGDSSDEDREPDGPPTELARASMLSRSARNSCCRWCMALDVLQRA